MINKVRRTGRSMEESTEDMAMEKQRMKIKEMKETIEYMRMESYNEVFLTALRREQILQSVVEILDKIRDHPRVNHSLVRTGVRQLITLSKELKEVSLKCVCKIVHWTLEESKYLDEEDSAAARDGDLKYNNQSQCQRPPPKFMFINDSSNEESAVAASRAASRTAAATATPAANHATATAGAVEYLVKMYTDLNPIVVKLRVLGEAKAKKNSHRTEGDSDSDTSSNSSENEGSITSIWTTPKTHKSSRIANKISKNALRGVFNLYDPLFLQSTYHLENYSGKRSLSAGMLVILDAVQRQHLAATVSTARQSKSKSQGKAGDGEEEETGEGENEEGDDDDDYYSEEFEQICSSHCPSVVNSSVAVGCSSVSSSATTPPRSVAERAEEEARNRKRLTMIGVESGMHAMAISGHTRTSIKKVASGSKKKAMAGSSTGDMGAQQQRHKKESTKKTDESAAVVVAAPSITLTDRELEHQRSEEHAKLIGATGDIVSSVSRLRKDLRRATKQEVNETVSAYLHQQQRVVSDSPSPITRASSSLSPDCRVSPAMPSSLAHITNNVNIKARRNGAFAGCMVDPKSGISYRKCKVLGQGAFAKVFECVRDTDLKEVAFKIFDNPGPDDDEATAEYMVKCMEREIRLLNLIQTNATLAGGKGVGDQSSSLFSIRSREDEHRLAAVGSNHIIQEFDHFIWQDAIEYPTPVTCMVMEKMQCTLLQVPLDRTTQGGYGAAAPIEAFTKSVMQQMLAALAYIHSLGIIHRDVKPENILVIKYGSGSGSGSITAKLADFGAARIAPDQQQHAHTHDWSGGSSSSGSQVSSLAPSRHDSVFQRDSSTKIGCLTDYIGSRWYRAPELLGNARTYTCNVDQWALGCALAEMVTGNPLFNGDTEQAMLDKIFQYYYNIPADVVTHLLRHGLKINHPRYFPNGMPKTMLPGLVVAEDPVPAVGETTAAATTTTTTTSCTSKSIHAILCMLRLPVRSIIFKLLSLVPSEREPCFDLLIEINNSTS